MESINTPKDTLGTPKESKASIVTNRPKDQADVDWQALAEAMGLDVDGIKTHQKRLKKALSSGKKPLFPIVDTCRLANRGVIKLRGLETLEASQNAAQGFVAFTPAAGASSRYLQILQGLRKALLKADAEAIASEVEKLLLKKATNWLLPEPLKSLLTRADFELSDDEIASILEVFEWPKALMPCKASGKTFLQIKVEEHRAIGEFDRQVFVVSPQSEDLLRSHSRDIGDASALDWLTQGVRQSTLRFNAAGNPVFDDDGQPSVVPAGHGTLIDLLGDVRKMSQSQSHSIFIRNIDNVMSASKSAVESTRAFLKFHAEMITSMQEIRGLLRDCLQGLNGDPSELLSQANAKARELRMFCGLELTDEEVGVGEAADLWAVQTYLFHAPRPSDDSARASASTLDALYELFSRPVNILGQVPNTEQNVGGNPVFIAQGNEVIKICIEGPHVRDEDKSILQDPVLATHFNPVFATCEIPSEDDYYQSRMNDDMWIMAQKSFKNQDVYYHETVLYEIVGNSATANLLFVEVPREVFNPHKSVQSHPVL